MVRKQCKYYVILYEDNNMKCSLPVAGAAIRKGHTSSGLYQRKINNLLAKMHLQALQNQHGACFRIEEEKQNCFFNSTCFNFTHFPSDYFFGVGEMQFNI